MEIWKADGDIHRKVEELIGKRHPDLALVSDEIVVVFREKAAKRGGRVILGTARKASPLLAVLGDKNWKFVLEIPADVWEQNLDSRQHEAMLDQLLCSCAAEEDPKSGNLKCFIRPPDFMGYRSNIETYGAWWPKDEGDEDGPSPVSEMFKADDAE